jgi:hypothetical protein
MSVSTHPATGDAVVASASTRTWKPRAIAVAAAVAAPVIAWALFQAFGVDLRSPQMGSQASQEIGVGNVIFVSLLAGLAGWALLAVLERFTARARVIWTAVATVALIVSLGGPMQGTGISGGTRAALIALHVVVAAVLIPLMARTARSRA